MLTLSLLFLQDTPDADVVPLDPSLLEPPEEPVEPLCGDPSILSEGAPANPEALADLEAWAFPERTEDEDRDRIGVRTDGLVVVHAGRVIYERYNRGYDAQTPHLLWSATKTLTNAMTGVAVQQGRLGVDDSICDYLDLDVHCDVTVSHLLEFSSGLDWHETYEGEPPTTSTVIAMLYGAGRGDIAAYVASTPTRAAPGTTWQYSSGDTNLLAAVVQSAMSGVAGFPYSGLFDELGMDSLTLERDTAGTIIGSSYGFATPRDMARFGQFMLFDGCANGERLLPEGWMERSVQPAPTLRLHAVDRRDGDVNGRSIWLNRTLGEHGETTPPWPSAPPDTYAAMGHWKQAIVVIPSLDLVIARTGDDRDGTYSWDTLLGLVTALVGAEPPDHPVVSAVGGAENSVSPSRDEDTGLLGIATAYGAKMGCSCAFVMERDDDFCKAWIKASPDIVKVRFDHDAKKVTARALGMKATTASWVSEREGCSLEP